MSSEEQTTSSQANAPFDRKPPSFISKLLAFVIGAVFLVLAFMFSLVALAVIAVVGLALGGWLWWKTRAVRKQMREQMGQQAPGAPPQRDGLIIEGEVIREETPPTRPERLLR